MKFMVLFSIYLFCALFTVYAGDDCEDVSALDPRFDECLDKKIDQGMKDSEVDEKEDEENKDAVEATNKSLKKAETALETTAKIQKSATKFGKKANKLGKEMYDEAMKTAEDAEKDWGD